MPRIGREGFCRLPTRNVKITFHETRCGCQAKQCCPSSAKIYQTNIICLELTKFCLIRKNNKFTQENINVRGHIRIALQDLYNFKIIC